MGAQRFPRWWVEYSPPFFGLAAAALVPDARNKVLENLRRIRGPAPLVRDVSETSRTFMAYAGVLAEVLDLFPTLDPTAMMMLVWWTVLSVGTDLGLALRARRLLQRDLPALALDHYGSGQTAPSPRPGLPA